MSQRPKTILLPIDASEHSERAVHYTLTKICRPSVDSLHLLHVQDASHLHMPVSGDMVVPPVLVDEMTRRAANEAATLVRKFLVEAEKAKVSALGFSATGDAREVIVARAAAVRADLIVMGTRGMGAVSRTLLGSVSDHVVSHATCPVLIVRPRGKGGEGEQQQQQQQPAPPRVILLAVDASEGSRLALRFALEDFSRPSDVFTLLAVLPTPPWAAYNEFYNQEMIDRLDASEQSEAESLLEGFAEQVRAMGLGCRKEVIRGDVRETICYCAESFQADLLLMGSRGLAGIKKMLLGSVSDYCAHHAAAPVLIVKPVEHATENALSPRVIPVGLGAESS